MESVVAISYRPLKRNLPYHLPEHLLMVDKYAGTESEWSVRILNTSSFADGVPRQIVIMPLSGSAPPPSGFF
jgi:hypothetical protein